MGHNWRAYDGCLEPKTPNRDWTTGVRLQRRGQCVAYGTLAALESMLRIHYYNNTAEFDLFDAKIGSTTGPNLDTFMGTDHSIVRVRTALKDNGIMIPGRYKIADIHDILGMSKKINDVPSKIEEAKKYLETSGPIIAMYTDSTVGSHCVAIVGYTTDNAGKTYWICKDSWPLKNDGAPYHNDDNTWNTDGTCKISGATGGYREIDAEYMLEKGNGSLHAILIQKLNISIRENTTPSAPITNWSVAYLRIKKQDGNGANLADSDPTFISMFGDRFNVDKKKQWGENCLKISPKQNSKNLDNLEVMVAPDTYEIWAYACVPGINEVGHSNDVLVTDGDTNVTVTIKINKVSQCAKEILYPFALHAIEKHRSDMRLSLDELVAINELLRTAEISKEDFIKDLEQRIVDLDEACNIGIDGAQGTLRATKKILEQVKSI